MKALCSPKGGSNCTGLNYKWTVQIPGINDTEMTRIMGEDKYALGCSSAGECAQDLAIFTDFFKDYPKNSYVVQLEATNIQDATGKTQMEFMVNQPPEGGTCNLFDGNSTIGPSTEVKSLVVELEWKCDGWKDPEEMGVSGFVLYSQLVGKDRKPMLQVDKFDPSTPSLVRLSPGKYNFIHEITDAWGAKMEGYTAQDLNAILPNRTEYWDFQDSGLKDELKGSGDTKMMMMVLTAETAVAQGLVEETGEPLVRETEAGSEDGATPSPEEAAFAAEAAAGQGKIDALDSLLESGAESITDPDSALILSNTVGSIVGPSPEAGEAPTIGLEVAVKAVDALENVVNGIAKMDIASPQEIVPAATSVASTVGTIMDVMAAAAGRGPAPVKDKNGAENGTSDDPCGKLSAIDKVNADKPGVVEYDTDVGDDINMEVNPDPRLQRCLGVSRATGTAGGDVGSKVTDMINQVTELLLSKSVVGEEFEIDTKNIKIYTKMTSGEGAKEAFSVLDTGVLVKLPEHFCLEPQEEGVCNAPVGISAVVYLINPRPDGIFVERLAPDTMVLDAKLSDRNHLPSDVESIYDPPLSGSPGILLTLPRQRSREETLKKPVLIEAKRLAPKKRFPAMEHLIPVPKADSAIMIEINPGGDQLEDNGDKNINLFLSYEKIPTYRSFLFTTTVAELEVNKTLGNSFWFLDNSMIQNRTGRWFLTVMELKDPITMDDKVAGYFNKTKVTNFTTDYKLRTYSAGCYYLDEKYEMWTGKGLEVLNTTYDITTCKSSHMTLFGGGFFIQPNKIDFEFVFAATDLEDNLTIHMAVLISLIIFVLMELWAWRQDKRDQKKCSSLPLPDNDPRDSYIYELLVFTGAKEQATCK